MYGDLMRVKNAVQKVSCGIGAKYMRYRVDMRYEFSRWENTVVLGIGIEIYFNEFKKGTL